MNDRINDFKEYIRKMMPHCTLCPRECGADRAGGSTGRCGTASELLVARASLHMWEEPCISGEKGSGTVFFAGCSLGCIYCQNSRISQGGAGIPVSEEKLADVFLSLQKRGAENINLVTAGHFIPQVGIAICMAKDRGLTIPIVYNSGGYEKPESLRLLEGLIDIWLPDLKYLVPETAARYSDAPDYPKIAKAALAEMVRQNEKSIDAYGNRDGSGCLKPEVPAYVYDEQGVLRKGVVVRHLLLPGHVREAKQVVEYLWNNYGNRILVSLMSQYTPMPFMKTDPLLGRTVTKREYRRLTDYALAAGITQGFFQEGEAAKESFIPEFDGRGILEEIQEEILEKTPEEILEEIAGRTSQ